ncbi:MAG: trehalose-phosphatase [Betaproteobacteria bacterium RBG_16_64_9]|nr:MAG: trehalose-phosphatase [Betaproteobacteria bacterium RBG_16_64_9]
MRTGAPAMSAARAAWFLDFDGTLVELAETPDQVRVEAEVVNMVRELERASRGAVALISGRRVEDIDRLFEPLRLPVAGQHGAERRGASGRLYRYPARGMAAMRGLLRAWVESRPGLLLEDKGSTLAVHFRRSPELAEELGAFMQQLVERTHGRYCLQGGKMVFEIRPSGMDKGSSVLEFVREPPFAGRIPVFVGDDITDESAFAVVLSLGGIAVKVGDGNTIAPWRLQGVADVHAWIRRNVAAKPRDKEAR